jgi:NAD(P)H-nitrite reductase large subunit
MSTRYLIIGMGVAGIAAVEGIRSADRAGEITVVGDDPHGFYSRPGLAYYLTGEVAGENLFPYPPEQLQKLNARFVRGRVARIVPALGLATLAAGEDLPYDRLLIATGAQAVRLDVPGSDLAGVVKLDNYDDARAILAGAKKSRAAVVVGGGITALELTEGLARRRVKVHYLLRGDRYWANVLDETESHIVEGRLRQERVAIHYHSELAEVLGKKGRVSGVRLTDGTSIPCDMVACAIGIAPRLDLARACGVACERGILADEYLETNLPGIFAAGDVAAVLDPSTGRRLLDSLWHSARQQGFTAGLNMAGRRVRYVKEVPFNVTRLAGLTTTIIGMVGGGRDEDLVGIARGDSETWREAPQAAMAQTGFEVNRVRLMVGPDRLVGGIVMGDQTLSRSLESLIRERVDITPIRARLLEPGAPIAKIIASFKVDLAASAAAASASD